MLVDVELTQEVIGAGIEVHRVLGPGLLESAYEHALCQELSMRAVPFRRQVEVPIAYKGQLLGAHLRIDILVDERLVVEVKAIEQLQPIHGSQLLTYLRLGGYRVGLLMNFNVAVLKNGIVRKVLCAAC